MSAKISMKAARVDAGLTQVDIASMMKISPATVIKWEKGYVTPKPASIEMYARLCNRSVDEIFLPSKVN